jgi:DNA-binding NarL/FixJ family response regulator
MIITLLDDHPILTESLKNLLLKLPEVEQVKTYNDPVLFLAEEISVAPDIIIVDLMMPGINGMKLIEICRSNFKDKVKIIVLSSITDVQTIKQAIRSGANGFLSKGSDIEELTEAILTINKGNQYIAPKLKDSMLNSFFTEEQIVYHLSPREKDVLNKVCNGQTIKEIAYDLRLSIHTVQYYHRTILTKLKVKRTSDLIVFAMQNGLYVPNINQKL